MSHVLGAIEKAGLSCLLDARKKGDFDAIRESVSEWKKADLLILGAIADMIRKEEVGDVVRFVTNPKSSAASSAGGVHVVRGNLTGLDFLREVAVNRICGDRGIAVRIDWDDAGFELAQVALGFGANVMWGALANKRGLPILEEETKKVKGEGMVSLQALKKKELEKLLSYVGRVVVFDDGAPRGAELATNVANVEGEVLNAQ